MARQWSKYQTDIFEWIKSGSGSAVVEAVAGGSKTTVLVEGANHIDLGKRLLFCAFNKKNVEDLKKKLPATAECATLNSVGHRAWLRHAGFGVELNSQKVYKLIDEIFPESELSPEIRRKLIEDYEKLFSPDAKDLQKYKKSLDGDLRGAVNDLHRLVALAKSSGLVPAISMAKRNYRTLLQDTRGAWMSLIEGLDLDIDRPDVGVELGRRVLDRDIETANEEICFDGQLFMPIIHRASFKQYDWIMADESQDLSRIQHAILKASMAPNARAILVGDSNQACYAFRGALTNSMDLIREEFQAQELPLSISYRCGRKIIKEAQEIVPHIEHHPDSHDGEVTHKESYDSSIFGEYDLVVCRNTRPLVELAYRLIREKVPCRIIGRDIQHGIVALIEKMKSKTIDGLIDRLGEYEKRTIDRLKKKNQQERIQSLTDRIETLRVFIDELGENRRTIPALIEKINFIFNMEALKSKQMLELSTIHRAKGSEFSRVFFLDRHRIPGKWATSAEQIKQERNLIYIAQTRAIKELVYITSDGFVEKKGMAA